MKQRENTRWIKGRKDKKGRLLCLVPTCNKPRQKYKNGNFRNYCKNHTYEDMRPFTSWNVLRLKCFKRDNSTCVKCGYKSDYKIYESNLIADHIKPIALGGDEWDLDNIQTLCKKCDKKKTKQDQKDIAKQRRIEKVQEKNQTLACSLN